MNRKLLQMAGARVRNTLEPALRVLDARRRKILPQMIRGILVVGSTVVTKIARGGRQVGQEFEAARKSFENHLNSAVWDQSEAQAVKQMERWVGRGVEGGTAIYVDNTEIAKLYAEKMEGLSWVRDADQSSRKGQTQTERGYWKLDALADVGKAGHPLPLTQLVYGVGQEGEGQFCSENEARRELYDRIQAAGAGQGLVVEDRGFDGDVNYQLLKARKLDFLIRQRGDRSVQDPRGRPLGTTKTLAKRVGLEHTVLLKFDRRGHKERWEVDYGWTQVRLPHVSGPLWLVVAHNRKAINPDDGWLMLLSTVPVENARTAERLLRTYVARWTIEEATRFLKTDIGMEQVRTLNFRAIRRLVQMAYWALLIVGLILRDITEGTLKKLEKLAEVVRKKVKFFAYRVRWALAKLLNPHLRQTPLAGI